MIVARREMGRVAVAGLGCLFHQLEEGGDEENCVLYTFPIVANCQKSMFPFVH